MPIFVKAHRRKGSFVKAHSRIDRINRVISNTKVTRNKPVPNRWGFIFKIRDKEVSKKVSWKTVLNRL